MITVSVFVHAPIEKVWSYWTNPEFITQWAFASDSWFVPRAVNDVRVGGAFVTRMEARDGSAGFDFNGTYQEVTPMRFLRYEIEGGRSVSVSFEEEDGGVRVTEVFAPEHENPEEMQRDGWQSILNNFKKLVEA
jgi:uncharacterized protein YndB with AHSA1/START domain